MKRRDQLQFVKNVFLRDRMGIFRGIPTRRRPQTDQPSSMYHILEGTVGSVLFQGVWVPALSKSATCAHFQVFFRDGKAFGGANGPEFRVQGTGFRV